MYYQIIPLSHIPKCMTKLSLYHTIPKCITKLSLYHTSEMYDQIIPSSHIHEMYDQIIPLSHDPEILKRQGQAFENVVISILSFSHNVIYVFKGKSQHFSYVEFILCKCFHFGLAYNFIIW